MDAEGEKLVLFMPSGRRGRFAVGTPLLDAARSLGVYIESVCGGRGLCSRCQVEVAEGVFAKHGITSSAGHLSPPGEADARYHLRPGRRLSCAAKILGDLVIDVPAEFAVNRQVVRKRAETRRIAVDAATRLVTVTLPPPQMERPLGDLDRLIGAIEAATEYRGLSCDAPLLAQVQPSLYQGTVSVAVHEDTD